MNDLQRQLVELARQTASDKRRTTASTTDLLDALAEENGKLRYWLNEVIGILDQIDPAAVDGIARKHGGM